MTWLTRFDPYWHTLIADSMWHKVGFNESCPTRPRTKFVPGHRGNCHFVPLPANSHFFSSVKEVKAFRCSMSKTTVERRIKATNSKTGIWSFFFFSFFFARSYLHTMFTDFNFTLLIFR